MVDALQLLRDDHKRVKDLFSQFEAAEDARVKGDIVERTLTELDIHAEIEEKIFYPAVRGEADADEAQMDEAEEEHHVVKLLIAELRRMKPGAERFDAKFTVLAENVKHHIDEEESEMLPKAAELGMARMNELGAEMELRRTKLQSTRRRPSASREGSRKRSVARATKPATRTAGRARSTAKKTAGSKSAARSGTPSTRRRAASPSAAARTTRAAPTSAARARTAASMTAKKRTAKRGK